NTRRGRVMREEISAEFTMRNPLSHRAGTSSRRPALVEDGAAEAAADVNHLAMLLRLRLQLRADVFRQGAAWMDGVDVDAVRPQLQRQALRQVDDGNIARAGAQRAAGTACHTADVDDATPAVGLEVRRRLPGAEEVADNLLPEVFRHDLRRHVLQVLRHRPAAPGRAVDQNID